jgi:hypothetical protein
VPGSNFTLSSAQMLPPPAGPPTRVGTTGPAPVGRQYAGGAVGSRECPRVWAENPGGRRARRSGNRRHRNRARCRAGTDGIGRSHGTAVSRGVRKAGYVDRARSAAGDQRPCRCAAGGVTRNGAAAIRIPTAANTRVREAVSAKPFMSWLLPDCDRQSGTRTSGA